MRNIIERLKEACKGHPHAKIPWPHRLLHDAIDEIERLNLEIKQGEASRKPERVEVASSTPLPALSEELEKERKELKACLLDATDDIRHWIQLGTYQREELDQNRRSCPTQAGIDRSWSVLQKAASVLKRYAFPAADLDHEIETSR